VFCRLREQWRAEGALHGGFQIDHFKPVTKFPNDELRYANLIWTCPDCNRAKSDTWPARAAAKAGRRWLNPTRDRMSEHLTFEGDHVKALSDVGEWNLRRLDLNNALHVARRRLVEEKADRLRVLRLAVQRCKNEGDRAAAEDALDRSERELLGPPRDAPASCRCMTSPSVAPPLPALTKAPREPPMRNKEARKVVERLKDYHAGKGRKGKRAKK
jgi:hypothetical protein